jgi:hypothetical protein
MDILPCMFLKVKFVQIQQIKITFDMNMGKQKLKLI